MNIHLHLHSHPATPGSPTDPLLRPQSLEESINRREFRTPPNVPLHGSVPKTEQGRDRLRRANRNTTIELVRGECQCPAPREQCAARFRGLE